MLSKAVKNLLLASISFSICLLLLEIFFRLGWVPNKQFTRLQPVVSSGESRNTRRVLIVGDSFFRQESSLMAELARILAKNNLSVYNLALSGNGPFEYLTELKTWIASIKPDTVVVGYYAGNDLTNVLLNRQFSSSPSLFEKLARKFRSKIRKIFLYHFAKDMLFHLTFSQPDAADLEVIVDGEKIQLRNQYLVTDAKTYSEGIEENLGITSSASKSAWTRVEQLLDEIHQMTKNHHANMRIVIFPHSLQVNEAHLRLLEVLGYTKLQDLVRTSKPQELLDQYSRQRLIPKLDLLSIYRSNPEINFYRKDDLHLSEQGDILSAQAIADFVSQN